jgi:hypothetical protein
VATSEQIGNATIIVSVGQQVGASTKQMLAAIEAALVESRLQNLNFGDRDSRGIFQQRPSQGWGSPQQIMDPYYAARAFFLGAGTNKGALAVSQSGTAGQLAQRVQRSAFPSRYDERQTEAANILAQLGVYSQQQQTPSIFDQVSGGVDGSIDGDWHLPEYQDSTNSDSGIGAGTVLLVAVGVIAVIWIVS